MYFYDIEKENNNAFIKKIAKIKKIIFFDKEKLICNQKDKICEVVTPKFNYEINSDYGHYSFEGAKYIGKKTFHQLGHILNEKNKK